MIKITSSRDDKDYSLLFFVIKKTNPDRDYKQCKNDGGLSIENSLEPTLLKQGLCWWCASTLICTWYNSYVLIIHEVFKRIVEKSQKPLTLRFFLYNTMYNNSIHLEFNDFSTINRTKQKEDKK